MKQGKTLIRPNVRWPVSGRLSMMLIVVAIVTSVLFLSACATHRKSVSDSMTAQHAEVAIAVDSMSMVSQDSASEVIEMTLQSVTVPMSETSLMIATDSLRQLPQGAEWRSHSGQASVSVKRQAAADGEPEYIIVYATCDSLELQCQQYQRTIRTLNNRLEVMEHNSSDNRQDVTLQSQHETKEKPPNRILTAIGWVLAGLLVCVVIAKVIIYKTKRK